MPTARAKYFCMPSKQLTSNAHSQCTFETITWYTLAETKNNFHQGSSSACTASVRLLLIAAESIVDHSQLQCTVKSKFS